MLVKWLNALGMREEGHSYFLKRASRGRRRRMCVTPVDVTYIACEHGFALHNLLERTSTLSC